MTSAPEVPRPFPARVLDAYAPHFEALAEGEIRVRRCRGCGEPQWPPRACCMRCTGEDFEWIRASEEATVYSYTVCHRAFHPWFADHLPYALVVADLDVGVRILGNAYAADVQEVRCGVPVRADFGWRAGDHVVLAWTVARS